MGDGKDFAQEDGLNLFYLCYLPKGMKSIEKLGEVIQAPAKYELNKMDTVPEYCYLVKKGRVICYNFSENGSQRIYNIFEPNSLLLEECLLFRKPCHAIFRTTKESTLVRLNRCALVHAFKNDIDIVLDFCEYQANKFLSCMELTRLSRSKSTEWLICKLLQIFAEHYGEPYDGKILITENITQQMIADVLAINRVTITKTFNGLKKVFLEKINGHYCIRSMEQLQQYMDSLE